MVGADVSIKVDGNVGTPWQHLDLLTTPLLRRSVPGIYHDQTAGHVRSNRGEGEKAGAETQGYVTSMTRSNFTVTIGGITCLAVRNGFKRAFKLNMDGSNDTGNNSRTTLNFSDNISTNSIPHGELLCWGCGEFGQHCHGHSGDVGFSDAMVDPCSLEGSSGGVSAVACGSSHTVLLHCKKTVVIEY
ncbi:hypothetical protein C0Q70_19924 [Pomacea canaliculata]|uniref:Uncharacterized protein n=1 Tax=Pomacea canaliculata TaxID=400727 RepID=A0A2T7NE59_POMCA|nr:hypothetical protein C0Q70_19924 [Pomacea canaliculata]